MSMNIALSINMRKFNDSELIGHSLNFIYHINNKNTIYLGEMHKFRNS